MNPEKHTYIVELAMAFEDPAYSKAGYKPDHEGIRTWETALVTVTLDFVSTDENGLAWAAWDKITEVDEEGSGFVPNHPLGKECQVVHIWTYRYWHFSDLPGWMKVPQEMS